MFMKFFFMNSNSTLCRLLHEIFFQFFETGKTYKQTILMNCFSFLKIFIFLKIFRFHEMPSSQRIFIRKKVKTKRRQQTLAKV
jgi:hypothetical protein